MASYAPASQLKVSRSITRTPLAISVASPNTMEPGKLWILCRPKPAKGLHLRSHFRIQILVSICTTLELMGRSITVFSARVELKVGGG